MPTPPSKKKETARKKKYETLESCSICCFCDNNIYIYIYIEREREREREIVFNLLYIVVSYTKLSVKWPHPEKISPKKNRPAEKCFILMLYALYSLFFCKRENCLRTSNAWHVKEYKEKWEGKLENLDIKFPFKRKGRKMNVWKNIIFFGKVGAHSINGTLRTQDH